MGPKQMNICASASHHASVTCAGSAGALLTHQESQWLLQPPLTHLLHFTAKSPLRSSKVSLFSLFCLFCEDLPTFNKPVTNEKCHCPRFPHGAFSCFQLSKRWDYEAGHGLFAGPPGVDRERISTIRSWSILSFKAGDKFSSIHVPSLTESPAAQGVWAESQPSKNVPEIWSRAGKWTQISLPQQADHPFSLCF